jgi:LAO/AO transport system kinase
VIDPLFVGIQAGDRRALARAITLVESERRVDMEASQELLGRLGTASSAGSAAAIRIGITGVPGVGKSTFIDRLGTLLIARQHRVAVLAIDPTSSLSGGSILGDKTRMAAMARDPNAFIRPSPGGQAVGGVGRRTREAILLCEAAGFDVVLVETIGVGQTEIAVSDMVDTFVLLMLAGAGDELQGIKRGIMELADVVVINKADGTNEPLARAAATEFGNALQLLPRRLAAWHPSVHTCSAQTGEGIEAVYAAVEAHRAALGTEGLATLRRDQAARWFEVTLRDLLVGEFMARPAVAGALPGLRAQVRAGELQPTAAALGLIHGGG